MRPRSSVLDAGIRPNLSYERGLWAQGVRFIAGIDEAGRGSLAGPVVAAAVVLGPDDGLHGVDDSKRLSPSKREHLYREIMNRAVSVGVGVASAREVDHLNVWGATCLAARRALGRLSVPVQHILMDGILRLKRVPFSQTMLPRGDRISNSIAAASIVAKVRRDRMMVAADRIAPLYHFRDHKGYCTAEHKRLVKLLGPCSFHRLTFAPLAQAEIW